VRETLGTSGALSLRAGGRGRSGICPFAILIGIAILLMTIFNWEKMSKMK
jgi:hypothetical protein